MRSLPQGSLIRISSEAQEPVFSGFSDHERDLSNAYEQLGRRRSLYPIDDVASLGFLKELFVKLILIWCILCAGYLEGLWIQR